MKKKKSSPRTGEYMEGNLPLEPPVTMYIDGYNVIFTTGSLKESKATGKYPDEVKTAQDARQKLEDSARIMVRRHPGLTVNIYYDGPVMSRQEIADGVVVIYSGGEGRAHRADDVIIGDIMARTEQGAIIVTGDKSLRDRARHRGAVAMSPGDFLMMIRAGAGEGSLPG